MDNLFINREVGPDHPPFVIAEMSANHDRSIDNAMSLIASAKEHGADAVKIQTYRPDTITLRSNRPEFQIMKGLWAGRTLYDLYEEAHLPWEWHGDLFSYAREIGISLFSSPFDKSAVDLLEKNNCPAYKIASFEIVDIPLIQYAASTGKPVIISTGLANFEEIEEAVNAARTSGAKGVAVLHCVSGYPAPECDYNLRTIEDIQRRLDIVTGLSDHTIDVTTAITSVAVGASIIEKHFTLDRSFGGPDSSFSIEPDQLKRLCDSVRTAWRALGEVNYSLKSSESENLRFRRSLYYTRRLEKGEIIAADAVRSVRPNLGLHPRYMEDIIGKRLLRSVDVNTPVMPTDIEDYYFER